MSSTKITPVPEFRWIPVGDGPPSVKVVVLVRRCNPSGGVFHMPAVISGGVYMSGGRAVDHVTHWSYIPEPVDDSCLLIIDECEGVTPELIESIKAGKLAHDEKMRAEVGKLYAARKYLTLDRLDALEGKRDHMAAQIGELDDVLLKLLDRVKILEVRRTATPKETRDAAMGVIDRSRVEALETSVRIMEAKGVQHGDILDNHAEKGARNGGRIAALEAQLYRLNKRTRYAVIADPDPDPYEPMHAAKTPICRCATNAKGCSVRRDGKLRCRQCNLQL